MVKFYEFTFWFIILAQSRRNLEYLLDSTSTPLINSTLTIWGTDDISNEELQALKEFIQIIGKYRTYVDTAYDLNPKSTTTKSIYSIIMESFSSLFNK